MKAFQFRLDSALRWRAAQNDIEKSKVAVIARRLADLKSALDRTRIELEEAPRQLGPFSDGSALYVLDAYTARARRQIVELEKALQRTEKELAAPMQAMLEANRRLRLVENLKDTAKANWSAAFGRELEAFAGETFLGRIQSGKRARSSGG